jgi:hypothetical protein
MTCSGAVSVMRVNPRRSLNQTTASIRSAIPRHDPSAEHALACVAAEIGFHQRCGHARERYRFDGECEVGHDTPKRRDVVFAEPVGRPGRPGSVHAIHLADDAFGVKAGDDCDIVGHACRDQIRQQRELLHGRRAQAAAQK